MNEKAYNELLLEHYKYRREIEKLSKDAFVKIHHLAYPDVDAKKWWKEYENLELIDKLHFFVDDEILSKIFEAYCIGFNDGCEFGYNN